jgi:acetyl esterase
MCLATTLLLRDQAGPAITALALYYGLYGLRDSLSRRQLGGPWDGLAEADLDYYLDCYLADPADARSPYVDCLAADLSRGVPATYLAAAELDPLLDDTTALAAILGEHGVACSHEVFGGVLHGFLHNSRMLDAAATALGNGGAFLRRALDHA